MYVAGFLAVGLLLAFGAESSTGSFPGHQHILTKRQGNGVGNCTDQEMIEVYSTLDPLCFDNIDMAASLLNSTLATGQPDQGEIDQLNLVLSDVCTESCAETLIPFYAKCYPNLTSDELITLCASDEDGFCIQTQTSQAFSNFTACLIQWLAVQNSTTCPAECKDALNTTVEEIGCCTSSNLALLGFPALYVTLEDIYSTCDVQDPGFCPPVFRNQTGGNGTMEDNCNLAQLYLTLGAMCLESISVFEEMVGQLITAPDQKPDEDVLKELNRLAEELCTDDCGGEMYRFFTECFPNSTDVDLIIDFCSANGDTVCRDEQDSEAYSTSVECSIQWLFSDNLTVCPSECKEALDTVINETGCCTSNNLDVYFYIFNATIGEDFYSACEVDDPGFCPPVFQNQTGGNGTMEDNCTLAQLYLTVGAMCLENISVLEEMVGQLITAPDQKPDEDVLKELNRLAEELCTDDCGGETYRFFTECFPNSTDVNLIIDFCSANGDTVCRDEQDSEAYSTSVECSIEWLLSDNPTMCPSECKEALDTVIDEIGCCTNNNLDVYFYIFNSTIGEDFYSACEVDDPGFCPVVFQDPDQDEDDGAVRFAAAAMWLLLVATVSAVIGGI